MSYQVLVHNWRGGPDNPPGSPVDDGSVIYSDAQKAIILLDPDLYWPLNDEVGTTDAVQDLGSRQYVNSITLGNGTLTFAQGGLYDGTAVLVSDVASIDAASVDLDAHVVFGTIDPVSSTSTPIVFSDGTRTLSVIVTGAGWSLSYFDGTATTSTASIPLNGSVALVLFQIVGGSVSVYSNAQVAPVDTLDLTGLGASGTFSVNGVDATSATVDDVAIFRAGTVSIEQLLLLLGPPQQYDPQQGIIPLDITPTLSGSIVSDGAPRSALAPSAWFMREDGTGIYFNRGRPSQMYKTDDYGSSWTGPFDKSAQMLVDGGGGDFQVVGNVMSAGTYYVAVSTFTSDRSSGYAYSSDGGDTWTSRSAAFYGFAVDITASGNIIYAYRNASSGGLGIVAYGNLSSLSGNLYVSPSTTNGRGALWNGTENRAYGMLQNGQTVTDDLPFAPNSGTIMTRPESTLGWKFATIPTSNSVYGVEERITGEVIETMPLTRTDNDEIAQGNFRLGSGGYQESTGTLIRTWTFTTQNNDNLSKIHIELNTTGGLTDWGQKAFINTFPNLHNEFFLAAVTRVMGAGPYWFLSQVRERIFGQNDTDDLRLYRFEYPGNVNIALPDPPSGPGLGTTEVLINVENATLAPISVSGNQVFDIGNDVAGSPAGNVVASQPSNVSTVDPAFGSRHLSVPYKSSQEGGLPFTQPYWNEIFLFADRDFTIEGFWKRATGTGFGYLCSSQTHTRIGGYWRRYGGLTISCNTQENGDAYLSFYIGLPLEQQRFQRDNDIYTGNLVAINCYWENVQTPGEYSHIAVCRENGELRFYWNGREPTTIGQSEENQRTNAFIYSGQQMLLGAYPFPYNRARQLATYSQPVYIDSFRVIIDEAIYSGETFTVPSVALTE